MTSYRPYTTGKNARNMKSVSQAKLPYFEGTFELWTHEHAARTDLSSNVHHSSALNAKI